MVSKNNCCNLVNVNLTCLADAGVKTKKSFEMPSVKFVVFNDRIDILADSPTIEYPEDWFKN